MAQIGEIPCTYDSFLIIRLKI